MASWMGNTGHDRALFLYGPGTASLRLGRSDVRLTIGLAIVLGILGVAFLLWPQPPQGDSRSEHREAMFVPEAITLAAQIHMLGRLAPSPAYVIETSEGLVLVDSGLQAEGANLIQQFGDLGLSLSDLKMILLTHVHGDHSLGAQRLRQMTGAKIYAGQDDVQVLENGGPREAFFSTFAMDQVPIHPTQIDVQIRGGEVIQLGDTRIEAIATPGHTPGSVCYLAERNGVRALFTGDTVSSLIADLGTYAAYLPPRYRGDAADYLASLQKLRGLPTPDLVLPGHPNETRIPHSPRLGRSQWHAILDRGIHDMQQLLARYEADGRDFLDGQPKSLLPELYYLGDYGGQAVYLLNTASGQLLFDAPSGDGWDAFLAAALERLELPPLSLKAVLLTSSDSQATAALPQLVQAYGCSVVVAADAVEQVADQCPPGTEVMTGDQLSSAQWFPVQVIPLPGRRPSAQAYSFRWHGKQVLVSGQIPIAVHATTVPRLATDLQSPHGDVERYGQSLLQLSHLRPDLWLPATPLHGGNANLYDRQWADIIVGNAQLLRGGF